MSTQAGATAPAGATPGAFAVSPSGAATYSIPLFIPPGTNGMQPQLSLNYNSQGGNGLLGMGWSIGGLSVIHRCGATIALDGFKGGVNYDDNNDRFCLDGERLINIGGAEYRTQHESWQKVVAVGGTASDPSSFSVTTKDGTLHYYGASPSSRIEAQGTTVARVWALMGVQDRNGNYLSVTYQEDNVDGEYRPVSVAYTGTGAVSPYNFVYFDYESRTDISPLYEGGSVIKVTQRLKAIRSCTNTSCIANNGLARQYNLSYDNDGAMGRSRLTGIQECGSDGVCLPATSFSWQSGGSGYVNATWNGHPVSSAIAASNPYVDLNGDGRVDFASLAYGGINHVVSLSTGSSFLNQTWQANNYSVGRRFCDLNGDGKADLVQQQDGSNVWVSLSAGFNYLAQQTWWAQTSFQIYIIHCADLDGDGRDDLISVSGSGVHNVSLSTGAGFTNQQWAGHGISDSGIQFADLNGDGRADYVTVSTSGTHYVSLSTSTGYTNQQWTGHPLSDSGMYFVDLNGDGLTDAVTVSMGGNHYVSLSTGKGYVNQIWQGFPYSSGFSTARFADVNGDGKMDFIDVPSNGLHKVSLSTGTGYLNENWIGSGIASVYPIHFGDLNGDGKDDYISVSTTGAHFVSLADGPFPDLLTAITNGLGAQVTVTYAPLTSGAVHTYTETVYPYQSARNGKTYLVASHTQSNGLGGMNSFGYTYAGFKRHLEANANLGFQSMVACDAQTNLCATTYFNQTYDGTEGTPSQTVVENWTTGYLLKNAISSWTAQDLGSGRKLVLLASTVEQTHELDINNSVVTTVNTSYSLYDAYGNPGSVLVNFNDGWTKTTNNTYNNDTVNWQLGQLLQSQVTANAPGQSPQTRTSSFSYDTLGRLATEVIEPNNATLRLTATYGYDSFGNRSSKTVTGADLVPTSRTEYFDYNDGRGQFMTSSRNALGHTMAYTYDVRTGAVTTVTDPNNIIATNIYNDGFGRKTSESRTGGPTTSYTYARCGVETTCYPMRAVSAVSSTTTGSGTAWVYADILGREVGRTSQGFGGNWSNQDTAYDNLGRVIAVSHPYFNLVETPHYLTYTHDVLGRVRTATEPGPGNRTMTMSYNGLTTTTTNPLTQTKTAVKNSQGQVASVTDAAGTMSYVYDPFGNLLSVTDIAGNIATMTYDIRGRKTAMHDPDMGDWIYGYNALGELISQTDAKGQETAMTYDVLGRLTSRVLPNGEGTISFLYDTAANGVGKLYRAIKPATVTETYAYTTTGRLSSLDRSIGGVLYTESYTYDSLGRLRNLTYPAPGYPGFTVRHVYDSVGHLVGLTNPANGAAYWTALAADAHGRLTRERFGNGLESTRSYDHETGDLQTIQTGPSGSPTAVQNSNFSFDALDNLRSRAWFDGSQQITETFYYDSLNRLTQVTGPAPKSFGYDALGNLTSKSGVGTYTYPPSGPNSVRPHAVSQIGGNGYAYDENGNQTFGPGLIITYTSFNKPSAIYRSGPNATFAYGPNHERVRKIAGTTTTYYLGRHAERIASGSSQTYKHYLYAGENLIAIRSLYTNGTSDLRYVHTDHLRSVEVLTNETGGTVQRLAYDAWGKRRNPNGTDATTITAQTTRGFTRHEHDDELAFINMNAREYDPVLGRFLQPDTIIPGATSSQAYNRYSYVHNNPLSFSDPTGHSRLSRAFRRVTRAVQNVVKQVKEQVARSTTYTLQKVSGVNYVGGLLSTGYLANPMFGFAYGASTGDWRSVGQATKQAAIMAGTAYAFGYVGDTYSGAANVFGHGVVGGTSSALSGGDFRSGFIGAGFGAFASPVIQYAPGGAYGRVFAAGLIGGAAADLAGGDFNSGFVMAGLGRWFNHESHGCKSGEVCNGWRHMDRLNSPDGGNARTSVDTGGELHLHAGTYTPIRDGIRFEVDWRPLSVDGAVLPSVGLSGPFANPAALLLPGINTPFTYQAGYAGNVRWSIFAPPQESYYGNSSGNYIDIYGR